MTILLKTIDGGLCGNKKNNPENLLSKSIRNKHFMLVIAKDLNIKAWATHFGKLSLKTSKMNNTRDYLENQMDGLVRMAGREKDEEGSRQKERGYINFK